MNDTGGGLTLLVLCGFPSAVCVAFIGFSQVEVYHRDMDDCDMCQDPKD